MLQSDPAEAVKVQVMCSDAVNTQVYMGGGGAGPGGDQPARTPQLGARPGRREAQQQPQISVSLFCILQSYYSSCLYSILTVFS